MRGFSDINIVYLISPTQSQALQCNEFLSTIVYENTEKSILLNLSTSIVSKHSTFVLWFVYGLHLTHLKLKHMCHFIKFILNIYSK